MNTFTQTQTDRIKREITRMVDTDFEQPSAIIAALNDISQHCGHVMPAPPPPRLIYSWPVEGQDDIGNSYGVMGGGQPMGMDAAFQTVELAAGGKLTSVQLWVRNKTGNFDVKVQVYAAGGVVGAVTPTGPVLAESEVIPNANLDNANGSMQEFIFSGANQIDLVAGESYAFVFTYAGNVPPSGEYTYVGMQWVASPPNNCGFEQGGWNADDSGTFTMYLYAQ